MRCLSSTFEFYESKAESMSGPIVRTGTTPEFWKNWDQVFGEKAKAKAGKKAAGGDAKVSKPAAEEKVEKKASKKAAKKTK